MSKKILAALLLTIFSLSMAACSHNIQRAQQPEAETMSVSALPRYNMVGEYSYGDSFEKIGSDYFDAEFLNELKDKNKLFTSTNTVAGYPAEITYHFDENGLCGADYYFRNISDDEWQIIIEKYCSKYGEPSFKKESTGWGALNLWRDEEGNLIFLTVKSAYYAKASSTYYEDAMGTLEYFHKIVDLDAEIDKQNLEVLDGV